MTIRTMWRMSILVLFFSFTVQAQDWPQFRGINGQGIGQANNLPVTWSDTENLLWKTPLPGAGASSPITIGDKLYVTCFSGYGIEGTDGTMDTLMLHLVCVDQKQGTILWDKSIKPALPESRKVRDHGYAAQTPASDGKHIYVFFGKSGVFKFDLNGNQIWHETVGTKTHAWGSGTSPVLYKSLVIVNASVESGDLVALNKQTGKEVWRSPGMKSSWSTPHLVTTSEGNTELVVSVEKFVIGFNPDTGQELWRCQAIPDYICPSIVSHNGIVYAMGGRRSQTVAIRAGGRGDVTETHKLWQVSVGANVTSPVVHEGHLYWASDRNQKAYCLNLSDGTIVYEQEIAGQPYASATLTDGKLYVPTRWGGTFVLQASPTYKLLARNRFEDRSVFNASAIVTNNHLILRSDRFLYCIGH